jgi:hypothetical protein
MIVLRWFGRVVVDLIGEKKFLGIYVTGFLFANLCYLVAYNTVPYLVGLPLNHAIGASGGVFAVSVAAATLAPNYKFNLILVGPVKIIYLVAFSLFTTTIMLRTGNNTGGEIAHVGGALLGFAYIKLLRQGTDLGGFVHVIFDNIRVLVSPRERKKMKVTYKNKSKSTASSGTSPYTHVDQEQIDAILDKISASGYDSLSKKEKEVLFKAGKNN